MQKLFLILLLLVATNIIAQNKKPITHSVYDGWKSLGERKLSNDGRFVSYTINPQEGDGNLFIHPLTDTAHKINIPRGYGVVFTPDGNFAIAKVKPLFKGTRQAKIKKKKPDEMPKDSLVIVSLQNDSVIKIAKIKSYKIPENSGNWLAYHLDTSSYLAPKKKVENDTVKTLAAISDSIIKKSLKNVKGRISKKEMIEISNKASKEISKQAEKDVPEYADAEGDDKPQDAKPGGSDLVLQNLLTGNKKTFQFVTDYYFDKLGNTLLLKSGKNSKDSLSKAYIAIHHLAANKTDTILNTYNDAKNFTSDETGSQWAFVAERDSAEKSLQKFYKLWYYKNGADSAIVRVNKNTHGVKSGYTVSENAALKFSKDGKKLFFGVAPIQPPKDTTLVDFETARLDIWHYNDDYIQPQQLKQLPQESKRSLMAVLIPGEEKITQLADWDAENITLVDEGNADWVLAQSTKGNRVAASWEGRARSNAYLVDIKSGARKIVQKNLFGFYQASPNGKYIYWYNPESKAYFTYNVSSGKVENISKSIVQPLYDVENDIPDFPRPIGVAGWDKNDESIFIKTFYDIWKVSPGDEKQTTNFTKIGKEKNLQFDIVLTDSEQRFFEAEDTLLFTAQNLYDKSWSLFTKKVNETSSPQHIFTQNKSFTNIAKAKDANAFLMQLSNIQSSELFTAKGLQPLTQITNIAAQQIPYNWLTAELVRWKMFDGKMSEGILYKPENFDPHKKYPVVFYFYEKNADGIYSYKQPAPSASTINIPYFVSNGYLVFDPNIYYKTGQPGESAYNSVVSAAKYLGKFSWVDSTRMGIQGQSWGGYQVAYLVTRTNMFKAAGAGAPVSNMTSAYGGIRWGTGIVRQFQYEKTQSRIGATLWQRPDLYLKNSPLFAADKINTPLLIMHNDADGAVPWYQGIELFSALRRLGKKVWMLQYNGEDHNLVERRNRKDLSIRLSQFFDYYLKGAKAPEWLLHGVPAVDKGRNWGLEIPE